MKIGNCLIGAIAFWWYFGGSFMVIKSKKNSSVLSLIPHFCIQRDGMVYDFAVDMEDRAFDFVLLFDGWWRVSSQEKVLKRWGEKNYLLNFEAKNCNNYIDERS